MHTAEAKRGSSEARVETMTAAAAAAAPRRDGESDGVARLDSLWLQPPAWPLDKNGPVGMPYEPLDEDFSTIPAFRHFERVAAKYPERIAVSDGVASFSYAELLRLVRELAAAIAAAAPPGAAIGLLLPNGVWHPAALLAAMAVDRPAVPLNPREPAQRLAELAATANVAAIVHADRSLAAAWPESAAMNWIDASRCPAAAPGELDELISPSVDSPAVVLYTSGSTGLPKGVVNSQRAILQRVQQHVNSNHINCDDVFMPLTGVGTIAGCRETLTPLLSGASLRLVDVEGIGIRAVRREMMRAQVTITYLVPALLRVLMNCERECFQSLRVVRIGGEKVLWTDIDATRRAVAPSCFIQIGYSSTETTGSQWFLPPDYPEEGPTVPVGAMLPGLEYAVVDASGRSLPTGEEGELLVKSPYVKLGDWKDGRTAALPPERSDPSIRVYATGDLVRLQSDGLIMVVGRKGRQIKINGRRVEPAELELAMRRAPHVADAVTIVTSENELVAFVAPDDDAGPDLLGRLRQLLAQTLPTVLQPKRLHGLSAIPRLAGGKVDVLKLKELDADCVRSAQSQSLDVDSELDERERAAARLWAQALRTRAYSGRWSERGGDSLQLLQFVMELETLLGHDLRLDDFTVDMTFRDVLTACRLASDRALRATGSRPALFMIPGSVGYGPSLAAFGKEMEGVAQVIATRYPELESILDGDGTVSAMVAAVLEEIEQTQPQGAVNLIGYSLGGGVAYEVAARLLDAGRSVAFFGVLDTSIEPVQQTAKETFARTRQRIRTHRVTVGRMSLRAIAKFAVRCGAERRLARALQYSGRRLPARARFILRLELEEVLRMKAFGEWVRRPKTRLPITATIFRCKREAVSDDLGWGELVARTDVVPIAGGHLDMLVEPHLCRNRPLIENAFLARRQAIDVS